MARPVLYRVMTLYSDYVFCVDNTKFEKWRDVFTDDCLYRIVSRENFDAKKPMSTLQLEGQAMCRPVTEPIQVYSVKVVGSDVYVKV